jgi:hypothetical protein
MRLAIFLILITVGGICSQESASAGATFEGIQLSSEPGKGTGEKFVTCYFIFKDKPSSYFYEVKNRKLTFEFNDVHRGDSPALSGNQPPIDSFQVEQKKVDINKEVKGLNPEWHDMVMVTFFLSATPKISVVDEFNVISFSYMWSDVSPLRYAVKEGKTNKYIAYGVGGLGVVAACVGAYCYYTYSTKTGGTAESPLPVNDLPVHSAPQGR